MPFIWIGFAIAMAVCEAATTQLVSLWFVLGAVAAAVSTIFTPSIFIQLIVFLAVSALSLLITRPLVKRYRNRGDKVSTNADRLIGQMGIVTAPIEDPYTVGQVKVLGETWSAQSEITPVKVGAKVEILEIVGVRLIVEERT
ncbi:MAG: NfeD family protein [Ruminococcus sp.]|nr:NfeD family protein [Ruminococcus sp.]